MAAFPASSQELAARMDESRRAMGDTIDRLKLRLRRDLDVRRQLASHLAPAAAAAAALGFLAGRLLRRYL